MVLVFLHVNDSSIYFIIMQEFSAEATINGVIVSTVDIKPQQGFVGFGTGGFYPVVFDDFSVMAQTGKY